MLDGIFKKSEKQGSNSASFTKGEALPLNSKSNTSAEQFNNDLRELVERGQAKMR